MSWALIGIKIMGFGRAVMAWLSRRSLAELCCIALAAYAVVSTIGYKSEQRHARKVEAQLSRCTAAREADQRAYRRAQDDAATKNRAHVADIEAQQKRISDERLADANNRLARLASELRARGPAAQGHSSGAGPSPVRGASSGTPPAPGLCLSSEQLLRAAQDEERHDQLITWIEQQMKVDPNK